MGQHRFFCERIVEPVTELTGTELHHLVRVLRLSEGQEIELFDGKGVLSKATIKEICTRKALLQINETTIYNPRTSGRIILGVSVAKGQRFDWLLEKCTELGADRITPVIFGRTVKQAANPEVAERWKKIAISAAKQCKRIFLPCIDSPFFFPAAVDMLKKQYPKAEVIFGSLRGLDMKLSHPLNEQDKSVLDCVGIGDVIAFVGPEGGLTDEEIKILMSSGAEPVRLTDTILRTETAAISICSILTALRDRQKK
jgi:16S rRNA (uracil1498-N3)-methyltransferase